MIQLTSVTKKFGEVTAVDKLSFKADRGEVIGFLGPNGAGKTTTMRLITGFLTPTAGTVTINGQEIAKNPQTGKAKIGYLPEGNPLYKDLTAIEMLKLTAQLKNLKEYQTSLKKAVYDTGIKEVLPRMVGELSKGYRQRVGLACALLGEPDTLILDEPTEGLDPNQRREIRGLIKGLGKNRTVILSTHVLEEATAICDRIIIINKGKIVHDSTVAELSTQSAGKHVVKLVISGPNLDPQQWRSLNGVEQSEQTRLDQQKYQVKLTVSRPDQIQPELASLACQNGWTIWELTPERRGLEEVFRELTN